LCFERALIARRFFDGAVAENSKNRSANAVVNHWNMQMIVVLTKTELHATSPPPDRCEACQRTIGVGLE